MASDHGRSTSMRALRPVSFSPASPCTRINDDIVSMIAEKLFETGNTGELWSLALVDRLFNAGVSRWLYRTLQLDFGATETLCSMRLIRRLLENSCSIRARTTLSYIRELKISIPAESLFKGSAFLALLANLVSQLGNLRLFHWLGPAQLPLELTRLLCLDASYLTLNKNLFVTTLGDKSDQKAISELCSTPGIQQLTLEITSGVYGKLFSFDKRQIARLALTTPALKSLVLLLEKEDVKVDSRVIPLPSAANILSTTICATQCAFSRSTKVFHTNQIFNALQVLSVESCRRLDLLFPYLTASGVRLVELRIKCPVWREGESNRTAQQATSLAFLEQQEGLETLELVSLGFSKYFQLPTRRLTSLVLKDLPHHLSTTVSDIQFGRASAFESLGKQRALSVMRDCSALTTFAFDVDYSTIEKAHDLKSSHFESLFELRLHTQSRIDKFTTLTAEKVRFAASRFWGCKMKTFYINERVVSSRSTTSSIDLVEKRERVWKVTKERDEFLVVSETESITRRQIARWSKALGRAQKSTNHWSEEALSRYKGNLESQMRLAGEKAIWESRSANHGIE